MAATTLSDDTTVLDGSNVAKARPGSRTGPQSHGSRSARRDALLDNAKFLLIVLVLIGHAIEPVEGTRSGDTLYFWVYIFHMPAFILISGYLAKSFDSSGRRIDKLLTSVLAPYLIFWGLYALQSYTAGRDVDGGPLEPIWVTWFLAALLVWRLSVPLWQRMRWPLAVAIGLSLIAGLAEMGEVFSLSRIISLAPFFVAGLLLEPHHLDYLRRTWVRVCAAVGGVATLAMVYLFFADSSREWVYWRESLVDRDIDFFPLGIIGRLGVLALAFALTAAVLSLTPRRRTWFTAYGALTMYAFLLHGLVIRVAEQVGWYDLTNDALGPHLSTAVNTILAVGLSFLLMSPWVRRATRWAVEPNVGWMLRRDRDSTRPTLPRLR